MAHEKIRLNYCKNCCDCAPKEKKILKRHNTIMWIKGKIQTRSVSSNMLLTLKRIPCYFRKLLVFCFCFRKSESVKIERSHEITFLQTEKFKNLSKKSFKIFFMSKGIKSVKRYFTMN